MRVRLRLPATKLSKAIQAPLASFARFYRANSQSLHMGLSSVTKELKELKEARDAALKDAKKFEELAQKATQDAERYAEKYRVLYEQIFYTTLPIRPKAKLGNP